MSIVRLSVLGDCVYAPNSDGTLAMGDYDKRRLTGRMGPLVDSDLPVERENAKTRDRLNHYLARTWSTAGARLAPGQPVVLMVHGFLFDPKQVVSPEPKDTDNPHGRVYHFVETANLAEEQKHHTTSWPMGLQFAEDDGGESGVAIAFGWQSQPGFASSLINHFKNFYARAYDKAGQAAWVLANVVDVLADMLPGHPIDLFCHSLGSRVVVRALAMMATRGLQERLPRLGRIVILGGAEYVVEAQLMQQRLTSLRLPGRPAIYNIVARENDVLDKLGENFGPRTFGNSQVIGHNGLGGNRRHSHWIDLRIDGKALREWMLRRGMAISGDNPDSVWDHWYYYTHPGNMAFYAAVLRDRTRWDIGRMRLGGVPEGVPTGLFGD